MERNRYMLLAAACGVLFGCLQACAKEEAPETVQNSSLFAAEVSISAGDYEGGGTIIRADKTYIISAAHLIAYFDESSEVRTESGTALSCSPVWTDPVSDIAILACTGTEPKEHIEYSGMLKNSEVREACPLSVVCLNASRDGICSGFITGTDISFGGREGDACYMELLIDAEAGMSGSGIYDDSGRYAGMLSGRFEEDGSAGPEALAAGISADSIMDAIDSLSGQ